nr:hypothetical protein [Tanacetum cinerariifolium]
VTRPLTHIPLRAILGVLHIGIRAKVIENQILSCRTPRIPRLRTLLPYLHRTTCWPRGARAGTTLTRPESDPDEDPEDNDDEDPEEDPADYPADHDEEEEEPYGDDADEEDEEQDEDDDDEEEEHPASGHD